MNSNKNIDKDLNIAASIVLLDVIRKKYIIEEENIVISNDGFYIEFFSNSSISSNDLPALENDFTLITKEKQEILLSDKKRNLNKYEKYYLENIAINSKNNNEPFMYNFDGNQYFNFGNFLSKIPFNTKEIKFFKILSIGGTKWLNKDENENLVRINAIAFSKKDDFKHFLEDYQDRKERDHRKIGEDLKIFKIDPLAGQGLPIWLPRGFEVRNSLSKFINEVEFRYHFQPVSTPILGSVDLYKTSGHYFHYKENMFPDIHLPDGQDLILRPMTCPHHVLVYKDKLMSYRDLPIRLSEDSILHRYEASGGLNGLERVRMMDLADIHIFARHDQIKAEIKKTYEMLSEIHKILGIEFSSIDLSLHDSNDKEKFYDNPEMWSNAENQLREALNELGVKYNEEIGEAAFYGPKIDFQVKTALGHIVTVSTIQLDFLLPNRFNLSFKNSENKLEEPVMIHVSAIGTYERFVAVLLEQTKGKLPLWLSPDQVIIIPINENVVSYAEEVERELRNNMIRTAFDNSDERLSKKIRNAQIQKIPYQLIIGDDEEKNRNISFRKYGEIKTHKSSIQEFVNLLINEIKNYK